MGGLKGKISSRIAVDQKMNTSKRRVCTPWNLFCRTRRQQVESGHLGTVEVISGLQTTPLGTKDPPKDLSKNKLDQTKDPPPETTVKTNLTKDKLETNALTASKNNK